MYISDFLNALGSPFSLFYTPAHAQSTSIIPPELMQATPILFVFIFIYFFILRPQTKKAKQHRDMIEVLRRGDRVLTAGGLIGTIIKVDDGPEALIELAEGVRVRVVKATLSQVLAKTEPFKQHEDNQHQEKFVEEALLPSHSVVEKVSGKPKISVVSKKKSTTKVSTLPHKTINSKDNQ